MTFLRDSASSLNTRRLVKTELIISYVLRYGVILCSLLIAMGLLTRLGTTTGRVSSKDEIVLLTNGQVLPSHKETTNFDEVLNGLSNLSPEALLTFGLLLLIALPILRVAMTIFVFLFERDWAFFGITLIVFSVLISGMIFGRAL